MELIFDSYHYLDKRKLTLALLEFMDYALVWRDQLCTKRRRDRRMPIETLDDMRGSDGNGAGDGDLNTRAPSHTTTSRGG
ncbi:unnamed protein product [Linum trigynum]|uniref:Uncharacterized protein n=1 Tax=Linum trigynum TaxID=586398 RepID=A0AAV2F8A7_9ROSI